MVYVIEVNLNGGKRITYVFLLILKERRNFVKCKGFYVV